MKKGLLLGLVGLGVGFGAGFGVCYALNESDRKAQEIDEVSELKEKLDDRNDSNIKTVVPEKPVLEDLVKPYMAEEDDDDIDLSDSSEEDEDGDDDFLEFFGDDLDEYEEEDDEDTPFPFEVEREDFLNAFIEYEKHKVFFHKADGSLMDEDGNEISNVIDVLGPILPRTLFRREDKLVHVVDKKNKIRYQVLVIDDD